MSPERERRGNISAYTGLHKEERLLSGTPAILLVLLVFLTGALTSRVIASPGLSGRGNLISADY